MSRERRAIRSGISFGAATVLTLSLVACQTSGSAGSSSEGSDTLTIAATVNPASFDPGAAGDFQNYALNGLMYQNLVRMDKQGNYHPQLAESYSVGADNKTWTFKLRKGIEFSDGTKFDAKAVCFNVDRMIDPKSSLTHAGDWEPVERCAPTADHVVQIKTKDPWAGFIETIIASPNGQMVSPSMAEHGDQMGQNPIGTGPYKLKRWQRGSVVELVRNPKYARAVFGDAPPYERVEWRTVPETTTRMLQLKQGQVDFAYDVPSSMLDELKGEPSVDVESIPGQWIWFLLDTDRAPFNDIDVRRAANLAVDKRRIVESLLHGGGEAADSAAGSAFGGYAKIGGYEYDPAEAKRLLAAAGGKGAQLKISAPKGRYPNDAEVAQAVADQLDAVGFKASVQVVGDWPAYQNLIFEDKTKMAMLGWSPAPVETYFRETMSCGADQWRLGKFCSPEIDKLIERASAEVDDDKRAELQEQLQRKIYEAAPGLFMYSVNLNYGVTSGTKGIQVLPTSYVDFTAVNGS